MFRKIHVNLRLVNNLLDTIQSDHALHTRFCTSLVFLDLNFQSYFLQDFINSAIL